MTNRGFLGIALMGLMASPVVAMKRAGSPIEGEKPSKRLKQNAVHAQAIFKPIHKGNFDNFLAMAKEETDPDKVSSLTNDPLIISLWKSDFTPEQKKEGYAVLKAKGVNINAVDYYEGATLLHLAVSDKDALFIRQLVKDKANINALDEEGETPLFYACTAEMIQECISQGAHINHQNNQGQTVLFDLASEVEEDKIRSLVVLGIDCEIKDNKGLTAYEWHMKTFGKAHPFIESNDIARNEIIMPGLQRSVGNIASFVHDRAVTGKTMSFSSF